MNKKFTDSELMQLEEEKRRTGSLSDATLQRTATEYGLRNAPKRTEFFNNPIMNYPNTSNASSSSMMMQTDVSLVGGNSFVQSEPLENVFLQPTTQQTTQQQHRLFNNSNNNSVNYNTSSSSSNFALGQYILDRNIVQQRITNILKPRNISQFESNVVELVDIAVQQRLRNIIEALTRARRLRTAELVGKSVTGQPSALPIRVTSDPGAQLRLIERLARVAEIRFHEEEQRELQAASAAGELDDDGNDDQQQQDDANADGEQTVGRKRKTSSANIAKRRRNALAAAQAGEDGDNTLDPQELARRARLRQLQNAELAKQAAATANSAAALALTNVGGGARKAESTASTSTTRTESAAEVLEKRKALFEQVTQRLNAIKLTDNQYQLLNHLRSLKSGPMDEQQTAQLKDLELRWDAMKKLTEHASVLDKQISEMQLAESRRQQTIVDNDNNANNNNNNNNATAATDLTSTTMPKSNSVLSQAQIALPQYTQPQITLDDCQLVREQIGVQVFDRFEIARQKAAARLLLSNKRTSTNE